jgi:hypothetical protein
MVELFEGSKTLVDMAEAGDLMTALSYFESELRPVIEDTKTYYNEDLLKLLKEMCIHIDNEEWTDGMENLEKVSIIVNG